MNADQAIDNAQSALDEAGREHTRRAAVLRGKVEVIEKKLQAHDADGESQEERLKGALRHARTE